MTSMNDLVSLGKKQGYIEYKMIETVLIEELKLMPDQVDRIICIFKDLGIKIKTE